MIHSFIQFELPQAYPSEGTESLIDQALAVGADSRRLQESAVEQKTQVGKLKEELEGPMLSVSTLRQLLHEAGHGDNAISRELVKLGSDQGMQYDMF